MSRHKLAFLILLMAGLAGCKQEMAAQPKYPVYASSDLFQDGAADRPKVPDTVSQSDPILDDTYHTGKANGQDIVDIPLPMTRDVLLRGQERYAIYCAPCHDLAGTGDGMIIQRGYTPPPSLHTDRLRAAPAGHFFEVITNGLGNMPAYQGQISVDDRWKIIAYIRALQFSQHAPLDAVPADQRDKLQGSNP